MHWTSFSGARPELMRRFVDQCNMTRFKGGLEEHKGHSAIIMAGGGNFNE